MRLALGSSAFFATFVGTCWVATALIAEVFNGQAALGQPLIIFYGLRVYAPWDIFVWTVRFGSMYPVPFVVAQGLVVFGFILSGMAGLMAAGGVISVHASPHAWGNLADARRAGLLAANGAVLGRLRGELLCYGGALPQIVIGPPGSGKGRGHVTPTLLVWSGSAVVLDVKGDQFDGNPGLGFPGTAGFRTRLGPVLRFAPTRTDSAGFNPLLEVRRGPEEVRDVQGLAEVLVDSSLAGAAHESLGRPVQSILVGVILHVLYTEPLGRKSFATVRELVRDLEVSAQTMAAATHVRDEVTSSAVCHPEVNHAARAFLATDPTFRGAVQSAALSCLSVFADAIVSERTARSDFRISDLMCGPRPVTLYLQPPAADLQRVSPLFRMIIHLIQRSLMESLSTDSRGLAKTQRLLLVLDEFPLLGRIPGFETFLSSAPAFGLTPLLSCQSLTQVARVYGQHAAIVDTCHVITCFAAIDGETARRISEMAGEIWELRKAFARKRFLPIFLNVLTGFVVNRLERRVLLLPGDVRAFPPDEQLVFVSGFKPFRTRKIKADQEVMLASRLVAATVPPPRVAVETDWARVAAPDGGRGQGRTLGAEAAA